MQAQTHINSSQLTTDATPILSTTSLSCLKIIAICHLGLFANLGFIILVAWQTGLPVTW